MERLGGANGADTRCACARPAARRRYYGDAARHALAPCCRAAKWSARRCSPLSFAALLCPSDRRVSVVVGSVGILTVCLVYLQREPADCVRSCREKKREEGKKLAVQARSAQRPRAVSTAEGRSAEPPSGLGRPWSTPAKWAKCLSLSEAKKAPDFAPEILTEIGPLRSSFHTPWCLRAL